MKNKPYFIFFFTMLMIPVDTTFSEEVALNPALVLDIENDSLFDELRNVMERDFPFLRVSRINVQDKTTLKAEHGGMRVFCIYRGEGEVFLEKDYRTREGDGMPLPADLYEAEPVGDDFAALLESIRNGKESLTAQSLPPVEAILNRYSSETDTFCGDVAGELWRLLEQASRPWSSDPVTESALEKLFFCYREQGFSRKKRDSWEKIIAGDQLIVCGGESLEVRGSFCCFTFENIERKTSHISAVRRLRYLLDTAGGCSPGFDPFRRLPTTWYPNYPGEKEDGLNFFNNHVVNIPAENSPTHFHPKRPVGGGRAQTEFYLVLDPAVYRLESAGEDPYIILYPDLGDLEKFRKIPLKPGMFVYMPPGTGHRGLNVFALILTVPGFKPGNELYLDREIFERTGGRSPYNENHLNSKNYERLEDHL